MSSSCHRDAGASPELALRIGLESGVRHPSWLAYESTRPHILAMNSLSQNAYHPAAVHLEMSLLLYRIGLPMAMGADRTRFPSLTFRRAREHQERSS